MAGGTSILSWPLYSQTYRSGRAKERRRRQGSPLLNAIRQQMPSAEFGLLLRDVLEQRVKERCVHEQTNGKRPMFGGSIF